MADEPRTERPRISYDPAGPHASTLRRWLLELGARPVEGADAGVRPAPQRTDVTRAEVATFVHALRGVARDRRERFDDHGSGEAWPRGSY